MGNKILTVNEIINMSEADKINAYRQGYRLSEPLMHSNMLKLGTSDCIGDVQQGTTKDITVSMTSLGTPGYIYRLYIKEGLATDFTLIDKYPSSGTTNNTSHIFSRIFDEAVGSYIVKTEIIDSCIPTALTDTSECTVNIVLAVADICTWIVDLGGWRNVAAYDIMTLVSAYGGNIDVGFVVTAAHIMGCVAYYGAASPTNGNNLTGCEFT